MTAFAVTNVVMYILTSLPILNNFTSYSLREDVFNTPDGSSKINVGRYAILQSLSTLIEAIPQM
jgi:hypothetical protein